MSRIAAPVSEIGICATAYMGQLTRRTKIVVTPQALQRISKRW